MKHAITQSHPKPVGGTGKVVLGAFGCTVVEGESLVRRLRIARTADIFAATPSWAAVDDGGVILGEANSYAEGVLARSIKLNPFDPGHGAFAATSFRIFSCADYRAATPVWAEQLNIVDMFTGYDDSYRIVGYWVSKAVDGLVVALVDVQKYIFGAPTYLQCTRFILCSHDRGETWESQQIAQFDCTLGEGTARADLDETTGEAPSLYVMVNETADWPPVEVTRYVYEHNSDHSWTESAPESYVTADGATAYCRVPPKPAGSGTAVWYRYCYPADADLQLFAMPDDTNITPDMSGESKDTVVDVLTMGKNYTVLIVAATADASQTSLQFYLSTTGGAAWTTKGSVSATVEYGRNILAGFPYNAALVYLSNYVVAGHVHVNLVRVSDDSGATFTDGTGNLFTLLSIPHYSSYAMYGGGLAPVWDSDN